MAFERLHLPAYERLKDHYRVVALCDQDLFKAEKYRSRLGLLPDHLYTRWEDMVASEDMDVIDIMVPIELNFAMTQAVAKAVSGSGKGIICEKPLAGSLEEALKARELPSRYKVAIMIAENRRYSEETTIIRDMVQNNRVGEIAYFTYNRVADFESLMFGDDFAGRDWRQRPEYPGGVITDSAVHDIATMRHIFGSIQRLHAVGKPHDAPFSPYSAIVANLVFASGVIGQFSFFCLGKEAHKPMAGLRIYGSEGMIYLEDPDCGAVVVAMNDGSAQKVPYQPGAGYYNELLNFAKALRGEEQISVPPEMEYGDLKTIHDMLHSAASGDAVAVDKTPYYTPDYASANRQYMQ